MPKQNRSSRQIPLSVDVDGVDVPASLRPPCGRRKYYSVRWKFRARWRERSTGTDVLPEAKRIGRAIVRGERGPTQIEDGRLPVPEFIEIQREHYANNPHKHKGERSFQKFMGSWESLIRFFPDFRYIQEVDAPMALSYIRKLQATPRDHNFTYETTSEACLSNATIDSHFRTLRAAWNRVRLGDPHAKSRIPRSQMLITNPWQEIVNDVPKSSDKEITQFDLENKEFESLLDWFDARPVALLFFKISFWANGRHEEMTMLQHDWLDRHGYIAIPSAVAKNGTGKVVRIPHSLVDAIQRVKVAGSPFIFGGYADELRSHYRSDPRTAHHAKRISDFSPRQMQNLMQRHIRLWRDKYGFAGYSHHTIRRTGMEISDEGELLALELRSAEKLRTTADNKRRNYLKRRTSKRHYLLADALYTNFCAALSEFPELAARLGYEPPAPDEHSEILEQVLDLSTEEKTKVLHSLMAALMGTGKTA